MLTHNLLVFDTETTGLPTNYMKNWEKCHMIQLSWIIVNISDNTYEQFSYYISNGYKHLSSIESLEIHHITDKFREEVGLTYNDVFDIFLKSMKDNDCDLVCHGSDFDISLLLIECIRYKLQHKSMLKHSDGSDTIVFNTKFSKLYKNKKKNLSQIVQIINPGWTSPVDDLKAHDALYDTFLCYELFKNSDPKDMQTTLINFIRRHRI